MTYRWLVAGTAVGTARRSRCAARDLGKDIGVRGHRADTDQLRQRRRRERASHRAGRGAPCRPLSSRSSPGRRLSANTLTVATGNMVPAVARTASTSGCERRTHPEATSSSYRLTPDDAGKNVGVTVLASKTGFNDGSANAAAVAVARLKSDHCRCPQGVPGQGGLAGQDQRHRHRQRAQHPDRRRPGPRQGQEDRAVHHGAGPQGQETLKLKKLPKGKHKIQVVYLGNGQTFGSKSKRSSSTS